MSTLLIDMYANAVLKKARQRGCTTWKILTTEYNRRMESEMKSAVNKRAAEIAQEEEVAKEKFLESIRPDAIKNARFQESRTREDS